MKTETNYFSAGMADDVVFDTEQSHFDIQNFDTPGPLKEDFPDDEDKDDETENLTDDDPPLDKKVVHSPVTTQPGGKP